MLKVSDDEHFLYQYDDNPPMPIYTGGTDKNSLIDL